MYPQNVSSEATALSRLFLRLLLQCA